MATVYKVEKGVPCPGRHGIKYPFREMAVGDSFFVPNGERNSIGVSAVKILGKGNFTIRSVDGGVRAWRLA